MARGGGLVRAYSARGDRPHTDTCLHRKLIAYMRTCGASQASVRPMGRSLTGEREQSY
jgi:hypothetical protein